MRSIILKDFIDIILRVEKEEYIEKEGIELFKTTVVLIDGSVLKISEVWVDEELIKYSYYWFDELNKLISGWDNAPHHKTVKTYPHHRHVDDRVLESDVRKLEDVLEKIRQQFILPP